jgi:fibronectin type III domain protein
VRDVIHNPDELGAILKSIEGSDDDCRDPAYWIASGTPGALIVSWSPGSPGDSPIDEYQVNATTTESQEVGGSPQTQNVPGSSSEVELYLYSEYPWTIILRAHNAAGWGPWSVPVTVPGL